MEILGVTFDRENSEHVCKRMEKCKRSFYGLREHDVSKLAVLRMSRVTSALEIYSICQPVLLYGLDCAPLSKKTMHLLESLQGNLLKSNLIGFQQEISIELFIRSLACEKSCVIKGERVQRLSFEAIHFLQRERI